MQKRLFTGSNGIISLRPCKGLDLTLISCNYLNYYMLICKRQWKQTITILVTSLLAVLPGKAALFFPSNLCLLSNLSHCSAHFTSLEQGREHEVSLYADDLLLYISNPSKSLCDYVNFRGIWEKFRLKN